MAHIEQINYCLSIKNRFSKYFKNKKVLDVGSLDVNGNNRYLFENCSYCGIDIGEGKNVDIVSKGHEYNAEDSTYDVIISTECFEHDQYYNLTIKNIFRMLKTDGIFIFTCATTGRPEHGTLRTTPQDAPLLMEYKNWSNYYKNLSEQDIREVLELDNCFSQYEFQINDLSKDLYFFGIKK